MLLGVVSDWPFNHMKSRNQGSHRFHLLLGGWRIVGRIWVWPTGQGCLVTTLLGRNVLKGVLRIDPGRFFPGRMPASRMAKLGVRQSKWPVALVSCGGTGEENERNAFFSAVSVR